MTLEELSVRFTADAQPLIQTLNELSALVQSASEQAEALTSAYRVCGENAGNALALGLLSKKDTVVRSARLVADAAKNALKEALDIHSPSRVTMKMGQRFDEGFVKGLAAGRANVQDAAAGIGNLSLDALSLPQMKALSAAPFAQNTGKSLSDTLNEALRRLEITVPLEVDGYRLGVAAIRAMQQVNEATGR
jgi:hypothetical protein